MKNLPEDALDPIEDLMASNEIMKLKLELEHSMVMSDACELSPETENLWLNYVYDFEKSHKECGRTKVFNLLGKPTFAKYDSLTNIQIRRELSGLRTLMAEKNIALDCFCEYDDVVIYRFITEELFEFEMDAFIMEGMVRHFIYEEFHPNHDHDLRRYATRFIESILSRPWDEEYDAMMLTNRVAFHGNEHAPKRISSIVLAFQEAHTLMVVEKIEIKKVIADIANGRGMVEAHLVYIVHPRLGNKRMFAGECTIHFLYENDDWSISAFELPGFSD